ncbi:bifunctional DNA primase/polymerase [Tsukamurella sp. USMM236]|uniref:bifunctional DNA primase/polymerase n=1 Tax=Tsukamurella sp. USMM236 TaxID=3081301 RepID=UPI00301B4753
MTTTEKTVDSPPGGYAAWAQRYRAAGWRGVLPLPEGQKWPPPMDYTGHEGADPDSNQLTAWAQSPRHQDGNLCLRLPSNVIAFDVDNHDGKPAAETIAAMEGAAGLELPDTWTSTSRADGSFHAFYRVPELVGWYGLAEQPQAIRRGCGGAPPRAPLLGGLPVDQPSQRRQAVPLVEA